MTEAEPDSAIARIWIDFIADNVAPGTLARVVEGQAVVKSFEGLRSLSGDDPAASYRHAVEQTWALYGTDYERLIRGLFREARPDDMVYLGMAKAALEANKMAGKKSTGKKAGGRKTAMVPQRALARRHGATMVRQGAIAERARTLAMRSLREQLEVWEGRICSIHVLPRDGDGVALAPIQGTGFLVGPDLLLTANHVIAPAAANLGKIRRGDIYAVFDHFDTPPLGFGDAMPPGARRVDCTSDWLVGQGADCHCETGEDEITAEEEAALKNSLDWALIRLTEPVGKFARPGSSERRLWFELPSGSTMLLREDRIIIPQHPEGSPQQVDFGRYIRDDPSETRLRYDTETDPGTSGAPCFNQNFALVGLHSNSRQVDGVTKWNQAVRVEHLIDALKPHLVAHSIPPKGSIWNTSGDNAAPHGILGRGELQAWVERAAQPASERRQRIYAAAYLGASQEEAGRSFSIDILRAMRREPIVVLGGYGQLIPDRADDVLRAFAGLLGLPRASMNDMPPRPAASLPGDADAKLPYRTSDGDKLLKWASDSLPLWFERVLRQYREPPSVTEQDKAAPERWPLAWIVFDGLDRASLSLEVSNLLAGLTGGRIDEAAVPQTLRRLRWLFLGRQPEFLAAGSYTFEALDPMAIGAKELTETIARMADAYNAPIDDAGRRAVLALIMRSLAKTPPSQRSRLRDLQEEFRQTASIYATVEDIRL